ncbi:hypothetical protein [Archaeoglobus veneficus]|uniref:Uncharacterized protein n=1 Tax=Archaeoglobus veneficus (strain DSM 11195 / SNP6) TaxID=693661 RepID=F2KP38_ARCVS|nr:hypothetical protein [Archaeoglobus veneficus]AEA46346.1 hypothetical protein Arcve_0312 [Archaeoglobus veneficus SNP6]
MSSWGEVVSRVLRMDAHVDIVIPKHIVPNPIVAGFIETVGENQGQMKDYELTLPDGRRIHVREYEHCYKVHWDKVSPLVNPVEHLRRDAPDWWKVLLALLGGGIGLLSRGVGGAVLWAMLGYFVGKATAED